MSTIRVPSLRFIERLTSRSRCSACRFSARMSSSQPCTGEELRAMSCSSLGKCTRYASSVTSIHLPDLASSSNNIGGQDFWSLDVATEKIGLWFIISLRSKNDEFESDRIP